MAVTRPSFTIGVEEEYLLVDRETRDLAADPPDGMWAEAKRRLGQRVMPELLKAQIEVGTNPHSSVQDLAEELRSLRAAVSEIAAPYGLAIIASSTHPFALWWEQRTTESDRYLDLAEDLAIAARRMVICGMHVHVAIEDPDLRIDLMNQVVYFLPHLLALSCSSPFWGGRNTGFKSYRMNVFRSLPRTGLPEEFTSWSEYQRHVGVLTQARLIDDASKVWWDIRPSARYPTLEMRVADICTRWEDAATVAALYLCLLHMLFRLRTSNQRWRRYSNFLVAENLWRAQRYGVEGSLMDYGRSELIPFSDLVDEMLHLIRYDAEELGCVAQVGRARLIAREGTSARRQLDAYRAAVRAGADHQSALRVVVDELIEDTVAGTIR